MHSRRDGRDADGTKELVAIQDGYRESEQSWKEILLDLRSRVFDVNLPDPPTTIKTPHRRSPCSWPSGPRRRAKPWVGLGPAAFGGAPHGGRDSKKS